MRLAAYRNRTFRAPKGPGGLAQPTWDFVGAMNRFERFIAGFHERRSVERTLDDDWRTHGLSVAKLGPNGKWERIDPIHYLAGRSPREGA
jgi:hypothetical protein